MRLGTTHKVEERHSRLLNRAMTGSKGLGRLSVQFLADEMELESHCPEDPNTMLYVLVDWKNVRSGESLQKVEVGWELRPERSIYADGLQTGTKITLKGLKTTWDANAIEELGGNVWMLRSPFRDRQQRSIRRTALDFSINLSAPNIEKANESFNVLHDALFGNWKARISGILQSARRGNRKGTASFTVEFVDDYPKDVEDSHVFRETVHFPVVREKTSSPGNANQLTEESALDNARFTVLVFKPEGRQKGGLSVGQMRDYLRKYGNVSVYDAGFRLPYYGSEDLTGQDWLDLAADQGRRLIASELLPARLRIEGRYLLDLPNPGRIFGAVDVDTNHERNVATGLREGSEWLRIQPGRDRLAPNRSFEQLRDFVRFGLDLYANRYRALSDEIAQKKRYKEPPRKVLEGALKTLDEYQSELPLDAYRVLRRDLRRAHKAVQTESQAIESHAVLLAPLATAGMAALALNHELTNDADLLEDIEDSLNLLAETNPSASLTSVIRALNRYRSHFNSYSLLFSPFVDQEERQATTRLPVRTLVHQVTNALRQRLSGLTFDLEGIPDRTLFPIGSFVEWSAILQNILFNSWNAMLASDERMIRFDASRPDEHKQFFRASDTGVGLTMPLNESDKLFEAFERRIVIGQEYESIAIGGQGLGLAIVRMIAVSRGVSVAFVEPRRGFSTSIELSWRNK